MIKELLDKENLPWELLLAADPDRTVVASYLKKSRVFVYDTPEKEVVGIVVLSSPTHDAFELMNVSVSPQYRRMGIAKKLVSHVVDELISEGRATNIEVKTGDLSKEAIALYQSLGFEIIETIQDYFIDHYADPIYEHGQLLRHQVVMQLQLA